MLLGFLFSIVLTIHPYDAELHTKTFEKYFLKRSFSNMCWFFTTLDVLRLIRPSRRCLGLLLGLLLLDIHFDTVRVCRPSVQVPCTPYSLALEYDYYIGIVRQSDEFSVWPYFTSAFGLNILRGVFLSKIMNLFLSDLLPVLRWHRVQSV